MSEKQLVTNSVVRLPKTSANLPATTVPAIAPTVDAVATIPFLKFKICECAHEFVGQEKLHALGEFSPVRHIINTKSWGKQQKCASNDTNIKS
jgi:hypothetical protein